MQSFNKSKSLRAHIFTVYVIYLLIVDKIKRKTVVWIVSVSLMSQRWSQNISVCRHLLVQHPHKLTGFERNFPCKNISFFSWNYIVTSSLDMLRITVWPYADFYGKRISNTNWQFYNRKVQLLFLQKGKQLDLRIL